MSVSVTCTCGIHVELPDNFAGKRLRCRACRAVVLVPVRAESIKPETPIAGHEEPPHEQMDEAQQSAQRDMVASPGQPKGRSLLPEGSLDNKEQHNELAVEPSQGIRAAMGGVRAASDPATGEVWHQCRHCKVVFRGSIAGDQPNGKCPACGETMPLVDSPAEVDRCGDREEPRPEPEWLAQFRVQVAADQQQPLRAVPQHSSSTSDEVGPAADAKPSPSGVTPVSLPSSEVGNRKLSDQANGAQRYWVLVDSTPSGPFTAEQVHAKLASGELTWEMRVCRFGNSDWLPLVQTPGFGPRAPAIIPEAVPAAAPLVTEVMAERHPAAPQLQPHRPVVKPTRELSKLMYGVGVALAAIVVMVVVGVATSNKKPSRGPSSPAIAQPVATTDGTDSAPPALPPYRTLPTQRARINLSATDGTASLQALAARLPPAQLQALGLGVLLTGVDIYGIRVRISNSGTVPVRVFPGNLRVHFGDETVGVTTANHPLFLQQGIVQPGYYVEGVVMYQATIDVGAVIRLLGTSFSYNDPSIEVTYSR